MSKLILILFFALALYRDFLISQQEFFNHGRSWCPFLDKRYSWRRVSDGDA